MSFFKISSPCTVQTGLGLWICLCLPKAEVADVHRHACLTTYFNCLITNSWELVINFNSFQEYCKGRLRFSIFQAVGISNPQGTEHSLERLTHLVHNSHYTNWQPWVLPTYKISFFMDSTSTD